jgi:diamine N-acetyltransferase
MTNTTGPDWQIRAAAEGDIDTLALIASATFLETFAGILDGQAIVKHCQTEHGKETYRHYLQHGATAWLAQVDSGGAAIGYALLSKPDLATAEMDGSDLELKRIYALSRFHGSGIGAALMEKATQEASKTARRLLLGVYNGNERAIAFYRKHGFEQITTRQYQVGDTFCDDIVLAKNL